MGLGTINITMIETGSGGLWELQRGLPGGGDT